MKLCSISDIHISYNFPERLELFKSFCRSKEVKESEIIILLGDIFDHMTGNKNQYIIKHREYFEELLLLLRSNKKIYVVEGNHDFHTEKIYKKYFQNKLDYEHLQNYMHLKKDQSIKLNDKIIYFGHGDILDYDNLSYKKWKNIYSSWYFKLFVSYILPFFVIEKLGEFASGNSKKRNSKTFNRSKAKEKYQKGFKILCDNTEFDIAIMGHTHIEENFQFKSKRLLNNGFFPHSKQFVQVTESEARLIKLTESSE